MNGSLSQLISDSLTYNRLGKNTQLPLPDFSAYTSCILPQE
ncbi:MAG: hypothetical protein ABSA48_06675 [Terracidiphilus sp.]|jgi:hypothetical protein